MSRNKTVQPTRVPFDALDTKTIAEKMDHAIDFFHESIRNIRAGTVTSSFIDTFKVPYYGQDMPIKHLATTIGENGRVMVKPFDSSILATVAKVLKEAGMNAYVFSKEAVAVSVPPVTGEEKDKIKGRVKQLAEEAKIAIRNIRKGVRQQLDGEISPSWSEDDKKKEEKQLQTLTDKAIVMIDAIAGEKLGSI